MVKKEICRKLFSVPCLRMQKRGKSVILETSGAAYEGLCGDRTWKTKDKSRFGMKRKEDIYEDGTLLRIAEAVR